MHTASAAYPSACMLTSACPQMAIQTQAEAIGEVMCPCLLPWRMWCKIKVFDAIHWLQLNFSPVSNVTLALSPSSDGC